MDAEQPGPPTPLAENAIHAHIMHVLITRFAPSEDARLEALQDVIKLSAPGLSNDERAALARLVPAVPQRLYEKWIRLFSERLLETIPRNVLDELCLDTEESRAALALTFIMFMESGRMEKVAAEDLQSLGISLSSNDTATQVGVWLRGHMAATRQ